MNSFMSKSSKIPADKAGFVQTELLTDSEGALTDSQEASEDSQKKALPPYVDEMRGYLKVYTDEELEKISNMLLRKSIDPFPDESMGEYHEDIALLSSIVLLELIERDMNKIACLIPL